jgi:hypothetical protein
MQLIDLGAMLSTLYGNGSSSGTGSSSDPVAALTQAEAMQTQEVAAQAKQPQTARDVAAFTAAVMAAKTPAQLLANPTALNVLMTANGMSDQVQYTALATKALLSDTTKSNALANVLTDTRWKTVASTYDFANKGLSVIQQPKVLADLANSYAEIQWRASLDQQTPGLSNALTFRSAASTITSVDQILGDPTLRTVVTTALGLPLELAVQPLQAQEQAISSRLDITQFKNPTFVEQFTQRYLIANQASSSTTTTTPDLTTLAVQSSGFMV